MFNIQNSYLESKEMFERQLEDYYSEETTLNESRNKLRLVTNERKKMEHQVSELDQKLIKIIKDKYELKEKYFKIYK